MSTKYVSTAFQKMHSLRKHESVWSVTRSYFEIAFRWAIPEAVAEMPKRGMYFVGILANLMAIIVFCLLTYSSYQSNINTIYLSPTENSGQCETVQRPLTGVFLADTRGLWESSPFFDTSKAIYQFHFQNISVNDTYWTTMIEMLNVSLQDVGRLMVSQTIDMNIVYWTAWAGFFNVGEARQFFNFYSDVGVVFNREYIHGAISSVNYDCTATSISSYDVGSYELSMTYSYAEYISTPGCAATLDPFHVGFAPLYNGDNFVLSYDVRSLVTALAINYRIIDRHSLRPMLGFIYDYVYHNITYISAQFYNTRYPGKMRVCLCLCVALGHGAVLTVWF